MATHYYMMTLLVLNLNLMIIMAAVVLLGNISSASPTNENQELGIAIQEMQKANYFTFVMLMNMELVLDHLFENYMITFLMPNDRMLSEVILPVSQDAVADFLLRHSIPSPLLFESMEHLPTSSTLPSSKPGYILTVTNNNIIQFNTSTAEAAAAGRGRSFFLNNVQIVNPDVCTAGSSIRCHGIDGVLPPFLLNNINMINSTTSRTPPPPPPPLADDDPDHPCSKAPLPDSSSPISSRDDDDPNIDTTKSSAASSLFLSPEGYSVLRMSFTSAIIFVSLFISVM